MEKGARARQEPRWRDLGGLYHSGRLLDTGGDRSRLRKNALYFSYMMLVCEVLQRSVEGMVVPSAGRGSQGRGGL